MKCVVLCSGYTSSLWFICFKHGKRGKEPVSVRSGTFASVMCIRPCRVTIICEPMENNTTGNERPTRTAMMSAVIEFMLLYEEPGHVADTLRGMFTCALASPEMDAWTHQERASAHALLEDIITLIDQMAHAQSGEAAALAMAA